MKLKQFSSALVLGSALFLMLPSNAAPTYVFRTIVPTSERVSQKWQYTFTKPAANWQRKEFNDSKWRVGQGGFGTPGTPRIGKVGTVWKTSDIWMRRTFNPGKLTVAQINQIGLRYYHDDAIEIYVNGSPAFVAGGYTVSYQNRPFFPLASRIIPNANNVIAVHCRQFGGGQYVDVGLVGITVRP